MNSVLQDLSLWDVAIAALLIVVNGAVSVALSLRPETLRLTAGDALPARWASLNGTIAEIEYLGPVTRFTVNLADGTPLRLMALSPPAPGNAVARSWPDCDRGG